MGWNTGWAIMQETVIGVYDVLGDEKFTKDICIALTKPYIGTDVDEGGKDYNLTSKNGKSEEQIIVDALFPNFVATVEGSDDESDLEDDEYFDDPYSLRLHDVLRGESIDELAKQDKT